MAEKTLSYKGKPLIRRENKVYYGNINEDFMIEMTVMDEKEVLGQTVAGNILIELKDNKKGGVIKKAERNGFYKALDIAEFWLLDALGEV